MSDDDALTGFAERMKALRGEPFDHLTEGLWDELARFADIEQNAFIRLGGQLWTAIDGKDTELKDANLSACYALGAEQRYGDAPAWKNVDQEQRKQVYKAIGQDCPNALARLRSLE